MSADDIEAIAHGAFRAPRIEPLMRRLAQYGVMLDIRSCFSVSAMLQRVSRWWGAARLVAEEVPVEEARVEVERSSPEDYLDPARWPGLTDLYLVQPDADLLPITIPMRGSDGKPGYESVWGTLTIPASEGPMWYPKALVLLSRWRSGKTPTILRVLRIRPEGCREGLRPVLIRGEVPLDPRGDLVADLVGARRHLEDQGLPHFANAVKIMASALSYGIAAQQKRRSAREVWVSDGMRRYRARPKVHWAPGKHTCWPIATFTVAGSWLLVELMEYLTRQAGGEVPLVLTDCGLIASANGTPPEEIARTVIARMERLCPLPGLLSPLAKPQEGTADAPEAAWCLTVAAPAYARYRRTQKRRHGPYDFEWLKTSGHGLSLVLDPETRRARRQGDGVPAWWGKAWRHMFGLIRPGRRPTPPPWLLRAVVRAQSYRSPLQTSAFGRLRYPNRSPIRPFATVYLWQYHDERRRLQSEFSVGAPPVNVVPTESEDRLRLRDPVTFQHVLALHAERPERKMANGWDTGRLRRYVIRASRILHLGREAPDARGQEGMGGDAASIESPLVYEPIPTARAVRAASRVLKRFPRQNVAQRMGMSDRRLRDVLTGRARPRIPMASRLISLAEEVRRNGGSLAAVVPARTRTDGRPCDTAEPFATLRSRGYSVARIAKIAGVTRQTVWRWESHRTRPRIRHQECMRAELADHQEQLQGRLQ